MEVGSGRDILGVQRERESSVQSISMITTALIRAREN